MNGVNLLSIWLVLTVANFGFAAMFGGWSAAIISTIDHACALMFVQVIRMAKS